MKKLRAAAAVCALGALSAVPNAVQALPTLFLLMPTGNQRDVQWGRLESNHFTVYHDKRAPHVGRYALTAVENAYPDLSLLLGVKLGNDTKEQNPFPQDYLRSRFDRVPIIVSTQMDGTAFANFTTQSIEIPTARGDFAGLYQHELVHRLMYEHFDPNIGVAGRGFQLAMVPTWWMEGLPEYLTQSMGRLETAGVARTMALENSFLSFDRMHALYKASGDVFVRGYITAGRFFEHVVKAMGKELPDLMNDFSWKTLTPPFVNAQRRLLALGFDKTPTEVYEDYIESEKKHWKARLEGMPRVVPSDAKAWVVSSGLPNVIGLDGEILLSQLTLKPYESSFLHNRGETIRTIEESSEEAAQKETTSQVQENIRGKRLPLSLEGSSTWDVHPAELENGGFWTVKANDFSNGTWGHEIRYVPFAGNLRDVNDKALGEVVTLPLATLKDPSTVRQIYSLGDGRAFALTVLRGSASLYALNAKKRLAVRVKSWESPLHPRLVFKARSRKEILKENCLHVLVDADFERTSLERVCSNGESSVVLPAEHQYVRDAVERADGSFVLLVGWHDVLGLARFTPKIGATPLPGEFTPLAPFPEWAEGIRPWDDGPDIGIWTFDGYDNSFYRVNPEAMAKKASEWQNTLPATSPWRVPPRYEKFVPPYARLAAEKRARLQAQRQPQLASLPAPATVPATVPGSAPEPAPFQSLEEKGIVPTQENADYRHSHWFSYPLVVPPPFDNWSIGLVSVPFNDEMERQRVQIFGFYNPFTNAVSGSVSYINNRVFDGFSLNLFSQERFNGYYRLLGCDEVDDESCRFLSTSDSVGGRRRVSYLREEGVGLATFHRFLPSSFSLSTRLNVFRVRPLFGDDSPFFGDKNGALGPQNGVVGQVGGDLGFVLFEKAFYDRGSRTGGRYVNWRNSMALSADKYRSLGTARTGEGDETGGLDYQSYGSQVASSVSYRNHGLTFRGSLSSTRGARTFNLREVFQPYRTYLLGSGSGLNQINYPLAGDNALFSRRAGTSAYRTTLDYNFPIVDELDTNLAIFYFETLRGEFVVGRGGITERLNLTGFRNVDSASVATRLTIDVKGVQVFPSLAYGKIIGDKGWALFSEIAFSQFF